MSHHCPLPTEVPAAFDPLERDLPHSSDAARTKIEKGEESGGLVLSPQSTLAVHPHPLEPAAAKMGIKQDLIATLGEFVGTTLFLRACGRAPQADVN